jgi:hypothetical protein
MQFLRILSLAPLRGRGPILFGTNFDEKAEGDSGILETHERRYGSPQEGFPHGGLDACVRD